MIKLVGFSGNMGCGKSSAIEVLRNLIDGHNVNTKVKLVKFAGPLYDMQEYIYNRISGVYTRPENFVKDRKLLQWLGTDWGRQTVSESIWVDIWKSDVEIALAKGYTVVCDDVRFDNEAEAIKSIGGKLVLITSDNNLDRITTNTGIKSHASEMGINKSLVDKHVANDGSYDEYVQKLETMFESLNLK